MLLLRTGGQDRKGTQGGPSSRVLGIVSRNGDIIGNGEDFLSSAPDAATALQPLGMTTESDINSHVGTGNLPRVGIVEPWVRATKSGYPRAA